MVILTGISLCSGAGGLELGLELTLPKYRTVCYVERETYAASILVARMEDTALDKAPVWDDVASFNGRPWCGAVDILSAGFPCQPFSIAGKRQGADDSRHLWPHVARIIGEIEPPFVFLENVAHHLRLGFPEVATGLVGMGYKLAAGLFTAAEVGAPHKRERLFILAVRDGWNVDDADGARSQGWGDQSGQHASERPAWPPGPGDTDGWERYMRHAPDLEPAVRRGAYGLANRVDRLRLCGNGVVPLVAAYAFRTLTAKLRQMNQE